MWNRPVYVGRNVKVAESLYRKALDEGREGVGAAIFWLKTRARWKETSTHEIEGKRRHGLLRLDRPVRPVLRHSSRRVGKWGIGFANVKECGAGGN